MAAEQVDDGQLDTLVPRPGPWSHWLVTNLVLLVAVIVLAVAPTSGLVVPRLRIEASERSAPPHGAVVMTLHLANHGRLPATVRNVDAAAPGLRSPHVDLVGTAGSRQTRLPVRIAPGRAVTVRIAYRSYDCSRVVASNRGVPVLGAWPLGIPIRVHVSYPASNMHAVDGTAAFIWDVCHAQ